LEGLSLHLVGHSDSVCVSHVICEFLGGFFDKLTEREYGNLLDGHKLLRHSFHYLLRHKTTHESIQRRKADFRLSLCHVSTSCPVERFLLIFFRCVFDQLLDLIFAQVLMHQKVHQFDFSHFFKVSYDEVGVEEGVGVQDLVVVWLDLIKLCIKVLNWLERQFFWLVYVLHDPLEFMLRVHFQFWDFDDES
jgi:hypothetical protein